MHASYRIAERVTVEHHSNGPLTLTLGTEFINLTAEQCDDLQLALSRCKELLARQNLKPSAERAVLTPAT